MFENAVSESENFTYILHLVWSETGNRKILVDRIATCFQLDDDWYVSVDHHFIDYTNIKNRFVDYQTRLKSKASINANGGLTKVQKMQQIANISFRNNDVDNCKFHIVGRGEIEESSIIRDEKLDIALFKLKTTVPSTKYPTFLTSKILKRGNSACITGFPLRKVKSNKYNAKLDFSFKSNEMFVEFGFVSDLTDKVNINNKHYNRKSAFISGPSIPGASGSPVLDDNANVIGMAQGLSSKRLKDLVINDMRGRPSKIDNLYKHYGIILRNEDLVTFIKSKGINITEV